MLIRRISSCRRCLAKVDTTSKGARVIANSIFQNMNSNTLPNKDLSPVNPAIDAARYFSNLQNNNMLQGSEYKQLPDDSQFIEKHYDELKQYRERLAKPFGEFPSVSELFMELSKMRPEFGSHDTRPIADSEVLGNTNRLAVVAFDRFINDLAITLRLNGGHLFTLDLLLHNKELFDNFEKGKE
ncbi:hypothetical protein OGAPHI_001398 [Ogataea philodendri]|uniref:Uncharacterized protein n=1 Tax=Ogataea philodendri TaxID=1378263 RepID=A0A9P8PCC9_9ASCO|nr:uncharacterized protein OGAPHI_001398 [Ogataea philodendri]KAH3669277.1 hypothetical protein OGAPHI_001398 [Ogataea philodendri]